jgi:hypothetical protein
LVVLTCFWRVSYAKNFSFVLEGVVVGNLQRHPGIAARDAKEAKHRKSKDAERTV